MARLYEDQNAFHIELSDEDVAALRYGGTFRWFPSLEDDEASCGLLRRWCARLRHDQRLHALLLGMVIGSAFTLAAAVNWHAADDQAPAVQGSGPRWEQRT